MAILTKAKQKTIDEKIAGVFLTTNKAYPDYPLTEIIEQYGVDITLFDFEDSNIMGAIKYPDGETFKRPVILVNKDKPPANRTFTLAHEFGHYLLHSHDEQKFRLDYESLKSDGKEYKMEETEANYFAGSLLMPENQLDSLMGAGLDLDAIAKYFGVSRRALDVRIAWLRQNP
jgi:Zn-dependent peptidase ImmA (M78 family)